MTDTPQQRTTVHEGTVLPPGDDDAERLRAEIDRTREHLGETVEQLAAKLDVKSRARAKAAELAGQAATLAKSAPAQARKQAERVRAQAAVRAGSARGGLTAKAAGARRKAVAAGQSAPGPAKTAVAAGTGTARRYPVPLSAAAGVLAALALIIWRLNGNRAKRGKRGNRWSS